MKAGAGQTGFPGARVAGLPSADPADLRGAKQPPPHRRADGGARPARQRGAGVNAGAGQTGPSDTRGIDLPPDEPADLRGAGASAGQPPSVLAPTVALAGPVLSAECAA